MSNPFFLLIVRDGQATWIDLDEPGWAKTYADLMRGEATWHLVRKVPSGIIFSMVVGGEEQPYYVARHVGIASGAGLEQNETIAYGIGKKRIDGHVDRLWVLPNGQICAGDDYMLFARALIGGREMARPNNPDIDEPEEQAELGDTEPKEGEDPEEKANLEGWTGDDGSKSLGHAKQPPMADSSGLGTDADDAGRTEQKPGQNSGANPGPEE